MCNKGALIFRLKDYISVLFIEMYTQIHQKVETIRKFVNIYPIIGNNCITRNNNSIKSAAHLLDESHFSLSHKVAQH